MGGINLASLADLSCHSVYDYCMDGDGVVVARDEGGLAIEGSGFDLITAHALSRDSSDFPSPSRSCHCPLEYGSFVQLHSYMQPHVAA